MTLSVFGGRNRWSLRPCVGEYTMLSIDCTASSDQVALQKHGALQLKTVLLPVQHTGSSSPLLVWASARVCVKFVTV